MHENNCPASVTAGLSQIHNLKTSITSHLKRWRAFYTKDRTIVYLKKKKTDVVSYH